MSGRTITCCLLLAAALAVFTGACSKWGKQEKSTTGALHVSLTNDTGEGVEIVKGELTLLPELGRCGKSVQLESAVTQDRRGLIVPPVIVAGESGRWPSRFEIRFWLSCGDVVTAKFERRIPDSAVNEIVTAISGAGCEYKVGVVEKPPIVSNGR